ncbi:WD40 repeat domain-containing protein [Nitrosomonas sp. Nm58]|uniref:WD40 repeat domain-containing protein n=1 Tax=Nitrosomonas sp. Nm58 TaxID=200126 RepID=UPI000898630C|nr:WD40 repeat domain-containing protein [Nitrosomonas sp. Nm58]SDY88762.1 WD40 repeat [Nitrosomonas sp. Nm58]
MMNSFFAPPEIFSAYAFAVDGSDPDLLEGTHLRLFAGLGASFPLTPFAVFKLASSFSEQPMFHITDRNGQPVEGLDLTQIGIGEVTLIPNNSDKERIVRIELRDWENRLEGVMLLDQHNRTIAQRNMPRWLFSAPLMHKLRVWGRASNLGISTKSININDILGERSEFTAILGLPIQDQHLWYVGVQDRNDGLKRVIRGAPMRLNPMDRPEGPFDSITPDDELRRVEAMLKSARLGGGLENLLSKLVNDDQIVPWKQIEKAEMLAPDGKKQYADVPRLGTLQMASIDPGLARFFGFADCIGDIPDLDSEGGWDTLAMVGLFALEPKDFERRGLDLTHLLGRPTPETERLITMLTESLERFSGRDIRGEIERIIAFIHKQGLIAAPFVTVVSPVPPWLPPSLPKPQIFQQRWQTTADNLPSSLYRASFAFPRASLASMVAIAANFGGKWISRHDTVDFSDFEPLTRAKPRILGHEQTYNPRFHEPSQTSGTFESAGLLFDQDIPFEDGSVSYLVRASDFFGRFGDPIDFAIEPPPRPKPPPPILRFHIERSVIDLASFGDLSPGVLKLTVAVPQPMPAEPFTKDEEKRLGSAIVVPRINDLAAGSLPLVSLKLRLGDQDKTVDLSIPGFFDREFSLPSLKPQEKKAWILTGTFINTAGDESESASLPVEVTDVRPPQVYPTGIGLFWTSPPGPSPEVELRLSWSAKPDSQHRVYLTDQQGLGLTAADIAEPLQAAAPSRGRIAAAGCRKVLDHGRVDRKAFRLLTEPPIKAGPDRQAVLATRLPRSLSTVQFLRIVPLGPDGAEPLFDNCGIVPIAVPDSRRPPAPRLDGEIDSAKGTAQLRVIADGFDRVALERDEPGLFSGDAHGSEPPRFQIRRAVGAIADPIYARSIGRGSLTLQSAEASALIFSATLTDDNAGRGLEPFVRYIYWAEIQLPPERRLPAGINPLLPPGGVIVVDPINAEDHPRPMSLSSAPRVLMHIPPSAPAAPLPEAVTLTRRSADPAGRVQMTIKITNPPRAHVKAIGLYRLAVWSQWLGQEIEPITSANGVPLNGTWPNLSTGVITVTVEPSSPTIDLSSPITLRLAFVDPMGRLSAITPLVVHPSLIAGGILWKKEDSRISLWKVDEQGNQVSFKEYGPFPPEWVALSYDDGRILWKKDDNRISLWTVDEQGNQVSVKEHGPFPGWVPLNYADGRILWKSNNNRISLWTVDEQGNQVSFKEHGPIPGWVPLNYADGRILWKSNDNRISLWTVDEQGNQVSFKEHGPIPGWVPLNYADGRILWKSNDNRISLWTVDEQGNQVSFKEHGPIPGWVPLNYADGRILWKRLDTLVSFWTVDEQGNQVSAKEHGPIPDWVPLNYADGRILWKKDDNRISLWNVDEQGNRVSFKEHGPFPGWVPLNYADGRILWKSNGNRISLWKVDEQGNQVSFKEHGFIPGWVPLNYADGRILWKRFDNRISLWTVDEQGNRVSVKEHGPIHGWEPLNYADGRILWRSNDNRISLWTVDEQGNRVSFKEHGPIHGWEPLNYADGRILWRSNDNRISLWTVDEQGNQVSFKEHGPFPGWVPLNYDKGEIF